ncbi:hypothetical protein KJ636_05125, partial [Patescibacteria group bacterium]|nr:hypothetical protein [Patescibacteria group bacterium]
MKKRIFSMSIFFSISLIAFLATETVFAAHTCSDSPLTTFSDGLTLKMVTIPAGGGTVEAGRIRLPMGSIIAPTPCSIELTIDKGVAAEGGTPF